MLTSTAISREFPEYRATVSRTYTHHPFPALRETVPAITCIEDLRVLAQRRVPRMFYDYADSGSWTESTYRANESDFQRIKLRQRVAVNMAGRSTRTEMVGQEVAMPVALAPTGLTGMQHADGEILAARAAEKFGVPFTLSTMSICSIEDVAATHQQAVLVPALHDARPRFHRAADRARPGGKVRRLDAHAGPADPRPAPQGHQERAVGAAQTDARRTSSTWRPSHAGASACSAPSGAPSATSSAMRRAWAICRP